MNWNFNVVTSDYNFSENLNLSLKTKNQSERFMVINKLVKDAVDNQTNIFEAK